MHGGRGRAWTPGGPKRRERHHSYDESVDEPAKLIEDEPVEIEEESPARKRTSLWRRSKKTTSRSTCIRGVTIQVGHGVKLGQRQHTLAKEGSKSALVGGRDEGIGRDDAAGDLHQSRGLHRRCNSSDDGKSHQRTAGHRPRRQACGHRRAKAISCAARNSQPSAMDRVCPFDAIFGPAESATEFIHSHGFKVEEVMSRNPAFVIGRCLTDGGSSPHRNPSDKTASCLRELGGDEDDIKPGPIYCGPCSASTEQLRRARRTTRRSAIASYPISRSFWSVRCQG